MKIIYRVTRGINKEKCDDSALIDSSVINDEGGWAEGQSVGCICLGDGVGGNVGGDEASLFVMKKTAEINRQCSCGELRESLLNINDMLLAYAKTVPGHERMATTFTGLFFAEDGIKLAHCGNTRVYRLQGSFLKQITTDQTTYQWLVSTGNSEAAENCNKSEIRGAFGGGNSKFADTLIVEKVFEKNIPPLILITSDGIHDSLSIDEMEDILADTLSLGEKADKLIETAVRNGSMDDCSVILIET